MTIKADRAKTIAMHYLDPQSFMRSDDTEVLAGEDWERRRVELWERSGGFCEWRNGDNERCPAAAADPHHVIRRSVRRIDNLWNLQALCRFHHELMDKRKPHWSKKA